jgi:hypothetical protein
MPALVAGIHVLNAEKQGVDGRNKSGHDGHGNQNVVQSPERSNAAAAR